MKNIEQILEEEGFLLTEAQKKKINHAVSENYRTVVDYKKQVKKIEDAKRKIEEFESGITGNRLENKNDFELTIRITALSDLEGILNLIRG